MIWVLVSNARTQVWKAEVCIVTMQLKNHLSSQFVQDAYWRTGSKFYLWGSYPYVSWGILSSFNKGFSMTENRCLLTFNEQASRNYLIGFPQQTIFVWWYKCKGNLPYGITIHEVLHWNTTSSHRAQQDTHIIYNVQIKVIALTTVNFFFCLMGCWFYIELCRLQNNTK